MLDAKSRQNQMGAWRSCKGLGEIAETVRAGHHEAGTVSHVATRVPRLISGQDSAQGARAPLCGP